MATKAGGLEMESGERIRMVKALEEDARHILGVISEGGAAAAEIDSLEIEWSAAIAEELPEIEADYRASLMGEGERGEYERLKKLLYDNAPRLRHWGFAAPEDVLG